jgi:superfamily I DNA/RNA helicase
MTLSDEDYERLTGPMPLLGLEAAAGAGKTHLACQIAHAAVADLRSHEGVLFLSHTNAARDVFRQRVLGTEGARQRITLKTLDAFCLEIVSPYASLWDLPVPLRPPRPLPAGWFNVARRKAALLLERKPEIASAIAARFPLVIADEHQDASRHHHSILMSLARAGARIRMFGDGLQAILTFDQTIPGWDGLMIDIPTITLSGDWRWRDAPELGEWLSAARERLREGGPIALSESPQCIRVLETSTGGGRWSRDPEVIALLGELTSAPNLVVLGRRNDDVKEIARDPKLGLVVNEGSDLGAVEEVIAEVLAAAGDCGSVAKAFADYMIGAGALDAQSATAIRELDAESAHPTLAAIIDALRTSPDLTGLVAATKAAKRGATKIGWDIVHPLAVQTVASLPREIGADEVRELAYQAQRAAGESPLPPRCSSTIHKAKGREFAHVVIPSLDASTFGPSAKDRQLLYVALSRAVSNLTLLVPRVNPSPLIQR